MMEAQVLECNGYACAVVRSSEVIIRDAQSALDFMINIRYDTGCDRIALNMLALNPSFFILSSGVAGEVLQKFVNYQIRFAVFGDFSGYTSKPLQDFIRESNRGRAIFFAPTPEDAVRMLCRP